jgi:hypothetical protein
MALFKRLKKSEDEVPKELPTLAVDEIKANIEKQESVNTKGSDDFEESGAFFEKEYGVSLTDDESKPAFSDKNLITNVNKASNEMSSFVDNDEKSFFKDLLKNVNEESKSLQKLDDWYTREFASKDIVHQMREYWEKQKPDLVMKYVGNEMKDKLITKTNKLHNLELEWQKIYFELMQKEEAIRQEEKELKETLSEFVKLCKKHLGKKK